MSHKEQPKPTHQEEEKDKSPLASGIPSSDRIDLMKLVPGPMGSKLSDLNAERNGETESHPSKLSGSIMNSNLTNQTGGHSST